MTHVTCRLTAKNRDQLRNPTLGSRVWATFTFLHIATGRCTRATPCIRHARSVVTDGISYTKIQLLAARISQSKMVIDQNWN